MYVYDNKLATPGKQLQQHYTTVGWAEALARKGVEVIVVKRFHRQISFKTNDVQYHFIKDRFGAQLSACQVPWSLFRKVVSLEPDIVQLHEFSRSIQTFFLRMLLQRKAAITIQHHGGPTPSGMKKSVHDFLNLTADGYFFTTPEQGRLWFSNKHFHSRIVPVMEGGTFFDFESRDAANGSSLFKKAEVRMKTGMNGKPVFLWVGNLIARKDPLTVLDGLESLFMEWRHGKLFMIYSNGEFCDRVKERIESSAILKAHVHLIGEVPHEQMKLYYASADYFVLGSHAEGSGYALSEALKCGCVPIVPDIPSFRMMTNDGRLGALWIAGNKNSFLQAAKTAINKCWEEESESCIKFFEDNLSFDAIAKVAVSHYQKLTGLRLKRKIF